MHEPQDRGSVKNILRAALVLACVIVAVGVVAVFMPVGRGKNGCAVSLQYVSAAGIAARYQGACVVFERATTPVAQERGLSGRRSLAPDQGMLFAFDAPAERCIWMKDMRFAIDVVWLDAGKRVVMIREGLDPTTYPESFCSNQPAQYVLELAPGVVKAAGIHDGMTIGL